MTIPADHARPNQASLAMGLTVIHQVRDAILQHFHIGINEADVAPGTLAYCQVVGPGKSQIGFAANQADVWNSALDQFRRSVTRTIVNYNYFVGVPTDLIR